MSKQKKDVAVGQFNKDLSNLFLRMCRIYGVSQEDICGRSKRKILVTARKTFAYSAWIHVSNQNRNVLFC